MSFINPSDMVEEDAADLQFPKAPEQEDIHIINLVPTAQTKRTVHYYKSAAQCAPKLSDGTLKCCTCRKSIEEPYIDCAQCQSHLCLQCFAKGAETQVHKNFHPYIIRHDNIQVFASSPDWTAADEKVLLDLISSFGYGNWTDIAKAMRTKTSLECEQHYHRNYFGGIFEELIGLSREPYFPEKIPHLIKVKSVDPPRHEIDTINFDNMAGYRWARGDFDTPYDVSAESIVSHIDLEDWTDDYQDVGDVLNCAVFKAYNHRLMERHRRHEVMKSHGLLMANKTLGWLSKYSEALEATKYSGKSSGRFIAFMQLMSGMSFDLQVESMKYYSDLKKYIFKLYELRSNGVTTFQGGQIYYKLKYKRSSKCKDKRLERYARLLDWRNLIKNYSPHGPNFFVVPQSFGYLSQPRKQAAPIDIIGLPGYDKLTDDERTICSNLRLIPVAYLEYKNILTSENIRNGYLRLADARRLIKIDVNKTRQIYDFLLTHGDINKPY